MARYGGAFLNHRKSLLPNRKAKRARRGSGR